MGKPDSPALPAPGLPASPISPNPPSTSHFGETGSSISLRTPTSSTSTHHPPPSHRYFDEDPTEFGTDDINDLPPLYTDHDEFNGENARPFDPLMPRGDGAGGFSDRSNHVAPFREDTNHLTTYYMDPRLDRDPDFLAQQIATLAAVPPRMFVVVAGRHQEKESSSKKDKSHKTVVDFEIEIELTHLLYSDIHAQKAWRTLNTAGNFEKVRRGSVFPTRAAGFGGNGIAEEGVPDLREWCRRYCASRSPLKCFTLKRSVEGYDWDMLRRRLDGLVRATNYRGSVDIKFVNRQQEVQIYNECRVNQWRLTRWIAVVFYATLLFLLTWPYLFFATKRWETLTAEWSLSRPTAVPGRKQYVSLSEEQWYAMWARTLQRAVLERRRGTLDQGDLERMRSEEDGGAASPSAGGFAGVMQASMEAMGVVNRSFGWGGDSC